MANKPKKFEEAKKESLKSDYPVYKPDPILLMRDNMKITQMRFFEAYLSKIDAKDPSTYKVKIPLDKVAELANVDLSNRKEVEKMCENIEHSRFDFKRYKEKYEPEKIDPKRKILRDTFPLFDRFTLVKDDGEYYIEVIPGTTMAEMLQTYQKNYATYELGEVYVLSNKTNMRMYSCFKRLQKFVTTKLSVELIKAYLGLDEKTYKRTTDFRKYVLAPGIEEINANTDITVSYAPYRQGRSIVGWSFTIKSKNDRALEHHSTAEAEASGLPSDELDGQMRFDDYANDSADEGVMQNPLNKTFADKTAELDYIDAYLDATFEQEFNKMLIDSIPVEVHEYEEAKIMAIRNITLEYLPPYTMPGEKDLWIMKTLNRFNVRKWEPELAGNVKYKAYGYYKDGLERWLAATFGEHSNS